MYYPPFMYIERINYQTFCFVQIKVFVVFYCAFLLGCGSPGEKPGLEEEIPPPAIRTGAERMEALIPKLQGQKLGLVVHPASRVGEKHLVDTLLAAGMEVSKIFGPEHGFRGDAGAGDKVSDETDPQTGIPIISLYGSRRKPLPQDLAGIDLMVFDLQDVGVRFYTYISTLHYLMEACAEEGVPLLVLDRPNPHGHYTDGPIQEPEFQSFVGMHPIPVVHGLTVGELARMINGEGWLAEGIQCDLEVLPCENYDHQRAYSLAVPPSPNLPNMRAVYLYPSLCFFEGTVISVGRGTDHPFQWFGHPDLPAPVIFTPQPNAGAPRPKLEGKACRGIDLHQIDPLSVRESRQLDLGWLVETYRQFPDPEAFFLENGFIDKLAGTASLREQIVQGRNAEEIRESWQAGLKAYREKVKPYLLYEGFR
jgi:uncharacterized protein YbbC (DUF1343 family)